MHIPIQEAVGTHGTSLSRAQAICDQGFKLPTVGQDSKRGTGCYFWEHYDNTNFAEQLAKAWWQYCHNKREYSGDEDPKCAVLLAHLSCTDNNYIDFEEKSVKNAFHTFLSEIDSKVLDDKTLEAKEICRRYDMFLDLLEEKSKQEFHFFRVQIPLANNSALRKASRYTLYGEPIALVVKDTTCIKSVAISYAA